MILITGISGGLGSGVANALQKLAPTDEIVGLARNPEAAKKMVNGSIEILPGDYNNPESLVKAFRYVRKILLISAPAFTDGAFQHLNVINAALKAGVEHIAYTSILRRDNISHRIPWVTETNEQTEGYLRKSGLGYSIIRNTFYTDNLPYFLGDAWREHGLIMPGGQGRVPFATRRDIAEGIASILALHNHAEKTYHLAGSESTSFQEIADILSMVSGLTVPYRPGTLAAFQERIVAAGFPKSLAEFWSHWIQAFESQDLSVVDYTLESLLGRKPTTVDQYLSAFYNPVRVGVGR